MGERVCEASPALPAGWEEQEPPGVPGQQEVVAPQGLLLRPWAELGPSVVWIHAARTGKYSAGF